MVDSVKSIFDEEGSELVVDSSLLKRIRDYKTSFINKNEDHIHFFGGTLLGVQIVRFTEADRTKWFHEVLQIDEEVILERVISIETINQNFHVSSDAMNLSCVWLAHTVLNHKGYSSKQKMITLIEIFVILQIKYMTSLLYQYFKYPADRATAEATYAQLTYKFSIKRYGNWLAVLEARANDIIDETTSIHFKTIRDLSDDLQIIYLLNDSQGRIRDMMKNIYGVFLRVHNQGVRIQSSSSVVEHDGVEILKDKVNGLNNYKRYINSIVTDRNSFIRAELVSIIEKIIHTMPPKLFNETLIWISSNYSRENSSDIRNAIDACLIHSFDYLSENRSVVRTGTDIQVLLARLRGVYMSSRSIDPELIKLRESIEKIVTNATGNRNKSIVASVRTGVLLYIILRTYTMQHYTNLSLAA